MARSSALVAWAPRMSNVASFRAKLTQKSVPTPPSLMTPDVVQSVKRVKNLKEAPGTLQRESTLIQHHRGPCASVALQGLVEGRLLPLTVAELGLHLPLAVAKGAHPMTDGLPSRGGALALGVCRDGIQKMPERHAPEMTYKPLHQ